MEYFLITFVTILQILTFSSANRDIAESLRSSEGDYTFSKQARNRYSMSKNYYLDGVNTKKKQNLSHKIYNGVRFIEPTGFIKTLKIRLSVYPDTTTSFWETTSFWLLYKRCIIESFRNTDVMLIYKPVSYTVDFYQRPTGRNWDDWTISWQVTPYGWKRSTDFRNEKPQYTTCVIRGKQPNSWLKSNPIIVPSIVKKVGITVTFRTRDCKKLGGDNFCTDYLDFYLHQSGNPTVPDPLQNNASYEKIAEIHNAAATIFGNHPTTTKTFDVDVKGNYIVLALHDQGSCSVIYSVTVSYYVCPEFTVASSLVSLPRSWAPANKSVPIQGSCVSNAVYKQGILTMDCQSDGVWNISSLNGRCICREDSGKSGGECKDCEKNKYNDQNGFNCTVIPSAPGIVQVIVVNQSALELTWQPPALTGDQTEVFYDVECRKPCVGEKNSICLDDNESCGTDVIFKPKNDGLNTTCVTIGNLSSFVNYTMKIYARNRVSDLAKRKHGIEANFAAITVRTNGPQVFGRGPTGPLRKESKVTMHLKIIYGLASLSALCIVSFVSYIIYNRWNRLRNAQLTLTSVEVNEAHWRDKHKLPLHGPWNRRRNTHLEKILKTRDSRVVVNENVAMSSVADWQKVDDFRLDRDHIKTIRVLGSGNFGQVSKAVYKPLKSKVAVKSLKVNAKKKDLQDMLTELDLMKTLKPHPHVVELIGYCIEKDPLLIVLEYLPYGDLLGYLRKSRGIEDIKNTREKKPSSSLTKEDLLRFVWMIADGMSYLSRMKIVHRDLSARNVLVGDNKVCKISDFGLARGLREDVYTRKTEARLPARWMPPESLLYGESSTKSDIWSYGIVMWEVFTIGESPYPGVKSGEIADLLQTGYRMPKPPHISQELYSIMANCWEEKPEERPTFQWLCCVIRRLLDDYKTYVNLEVYNADDYVNFNVMRD